MKACKMLREEVMMRLEMSKWFITTTRQFTKEIKVKKLLSKCPFL
jgi:hypothetical protein